MENVPKSKETWHVWWDKVWHQWRALVWKNFHLRKRQPLRLVVEIIGPVFLFMILALVRTRGLKENIPECHFDAKPLPSAGLIPFMQGLICTSQNTCQNNTQQSEMRGRLDNFNQSAVTILLNDIEGLLANKSEREELTQFIDDINTLSQLGDLIRNGSAKGGIQVSTLFLHPENIRQAIANQSIATSLPQDVIDELLNATVNPQRFLEYVWKDRPDLLNSSWSPLRIIEGLSQFNWSSASLRQVTCQESYDQQFIIYKDTKEAARIREILCNLTQAEFDLLAQDFRDNFDFWRVLGELSDYASNNTGRQALNFNRDVYLRFRRFLDEVRDLASFESLSRDVNTTLSEMRRARQTNNRTSAMNGLGELVCGRTTSVFTTTDGAADDIFSESYNEDSDDTEAYIDDPNTTPFCNDLFRSIWSRRVTRIIWRQLKPLIQGKILYSPDTAATRKIIQLANGTFAEFGRLGRILRSGIDYLPKVQNYFATSQNLDAVRELVRMCAAGLLPIPNTTDVSACKTYDQWLYNGPRVAGRYDWRQSIDMLNQTLLDAEAYLQCFVINKFEGYENESALVNASLRYMAANKFWAGVVFDVDVNSDVVPKYVQYKIRMDVEKVDGTKNFKVVDNYWTPGPRNSPQDMKYFTHGFIYIQDMVERAIIAAVTGRSANSTPGAYMQQFPYPCYIYDTFITAISRSLPLFMVLAWTYTVSMIVKDIVYEKEKRLKEVMKVMGLGNNVHWAAWFFHCMCLMVVSVVLLVAVLKVGKTVQFSNALLLLVFMLTFSMATVMQCFMISTWFSRANLAAACGAIIYFCLYLPYSFMVAWEENIGDGGKTLSCLLSSVAFSFGCGIIAKYEEQGTGVQWNNIRLSPSPDSDFTLVTCLCMMLIDSCIYWIITWYIENAFPGQFGVPRRWYFPLTKSYWSGHSYSSETEPNLELGMATQFGDDFETPPSGLKTGVSIKNLRKYYKSGKKLAIDGLTLEFYENQITSFLGHNGAGKTTTMSILTGLFPPTSGTAYIYNRDIRTQMSDIRQNLGMCPQYNVLFDKLTGEQHLYFYSRLKMMMKTPERMRDEITQMLQDVGLEDKRTCLAEKLSGGMKRKLSVAIAFVGGAKCVILDEPTAGVDPHSRRSIWDLLLKYRAERTIILSTHHMDEADLLGDRIAIISQGKLRCCGSSLFLKDRYGDGYTLTLSTATEAGDNYRNNMDHGVVKPEDVNHVQLSESADFLHPPPGFDVDYVTNYIRKFVPGAALVESVATELSYRLPDDGAHNGQFERLFTELDANLATLHVTGYGISDTTLEEVFLKVAEEAESDENDLQAKATDAGRYPKVKRCKLYRHLSKLRRSSRMDDKECLFINGLETPSESTTDLSETASVDEPQAYHVGANAAFARRQFWALFVKRFHFVRRNKKGWIAEIVLPVAFVCFAMIFAMITPGLQENPPMEVHPWLMNPKRGDPRLYTFYSNDAPHDDVISRYEAIYWQHSGIGTRCMDPAVHQISGYPCQPQSATGYTPVRPAIPPSTTTRTPPCSCKTGYQTCPAESLDQNLPRLLLETGDYVIDMTGKNISDWLVKTSDQYRKTRYGGFSFGEFNDIVRTNASELYSILDRLSRAANNGTSVIDQAAGFWSDLNKFIVDVEVQNNVKIWFNNKGWISSIGYNNIMNNILLRAGLPLGTDISQYGISVVQHPMALTPAQRYFATNLQSATDVLIAINVIFAMSFIPASFVLFLIEERVSNSKHLQLVSGVRPSVYWLANFAWDMMGYCISTVLCVLIFLMFNKQSYVSPANAPVLICLLLLYGWALIPIMYPFNYVFDVPSSAFVTLSSINVFIGIVTTVATFILELLFEDKALVQINDILKKVFLVFPQYCLGRGLLDMARNQLFSDMYASLGESVFQNPFNWDMVGKNLFALIVQGAVGLALVLLIQFRFFCKPRAVKAIVKTEAEDDDVMKERNRVMQGAANEELVQLHNLTKVYGRFGKSKHTAVSRLSLGIPRGQCFGLLGVNGAGKTTTFKMLTGDEEVTEGEAYMCGYSILTDMKLVRQNIGYCPQFDALSSLLTGREHLEFYARLRGVPEQYVGKVAINAIKRMNLNQYADKVSSQYSGGNKRKLSTAIALIGNPQVIFLDEPTSGMDAKARRFLWTCILRIVQEGRVVVLTSHSMEECEALCNRMAIMVNGEFKCLGSVQHLKNKFGDGYTLIFKVKGSSPNLHAINAFIRHTFPAVKLKEQHYNTIQYQLPSDGIQLGRVFGQIEAVREALNIEDYSVTQTSLDRVFINFAQKQKDEPEEVSFNGDTGPTTDGVDGFVNKMYESFGAYRESNTSNQPSGEGDAAGIR